MMIHRPSGTIFENRKQCRIVMGYTRYCKALKNKDFEFINDSEVKK